TRVLTAEFGNGMTFRVTMQRPDLFTEKVCNGSTCAEEGVCAGTELFAAGHAPGHFTAKFVRLGCPCAASGECKCSEKASCGSDCAASNSTCKCCQCAAASHESTTHEKVVHESKCGEETCELTDVIVKHLQHQDEFAPFAPHKLMLQIAQLMAEKAAA